MPEQSRRTFLISTGAAAAAGAAVVATGESAAAATGHPTSARPAVSTEHPVVAYVSDVQHGRITLMHGDAEVVVTDPELARAIAGKVI
jgi:hypothetical protein